MWQRRSKKSPIRTPRVWVGLFFVPHRSVADGQRGLTCFRILTKATAITPPTRAVTNCGQYCVPPLQIGKAEDHQAVADHNERDGRGEGGGQLTEEQCGRRCENADQPANHGADDPSGGIEDRVDGRSGDKLV